ncbi:MAG TPA: pirin family protein [Steroidobacteraceae bacterium]|nr:pirin family protein [Steroidobacteraceae bacterium]
MKRVQQIFDPPSGHWVGDGFPVRSLFTYSDHAQQLSPFLLLDYAGPAMFSPTQQRRGVGEHPHRGFETVTIVYEGEVEHRDSTGAGGRIGPGDVQWMTAGAGIVHEEFHSQQFARSGGRLHMVQLWVNLPARHKMAPPTYQTLLDRDIPRVELPGGAGTLRVIAGEYDGRRGPAHTFTPMDVWDLRLIGGRELRLPFPAGRTVALVVLSGTVRVGTDPGDAGQVAGEAQLVQFDRQAGEVVLSAQADASALVLSGVPLDEPIVGYGPFVMNSRSEILQAIEDFNAGRFGQMAPRDLASVPSA